MQVPSLYVSPLSSPPLPICPWSMFPFAQFPPIYLLENFSWLLETVWPYPEFYFSPSHPAVRLFPAQCIKSQKIIAERSHLDSILRIDPDSYLQVIYKDWQRLWFPLLAIRTLSLERWWPSPGFLKQWASTLNLTLIRWLCGVKHLVEGELPSLIFQICFSIFGTALAAAEVRTLNPLPISAI